MINATDKKIISEARRFHQILLESSEYESSRYADEILLYLYNLQDNYTILKSRSPRFSQGPIISLRDLIYQLESRPDETFRNGDMKSRMMLILDDIASERVEAVVKHWPHNSQMET